MELTTSDLWNLLFGITGFLLVATVYSFWYDYRQDKRDREIWALFDEIYDGNTDGRYGDPR